MYRDPYFIAFTLADFLFCCFFFPFFFFGRIQLLCQSQNYHWFYANFSNTLHTTSRYTFGELLFVAMVHSRSMFDKWHYWMNKSAMRSIIHGLLIKIHRHPNAIQPRGDPIQCKVKSVQLCRQDFGGEWCGFNISHGM